MEQRIYARWLAIGTRIGLAWLVVSFALYMLALLDPHVPHSELPRLWRLPVGEYVAASGAPTGWDWIALLHRGDYLNFIGVALFAGVSILCYARIVPTLIASGERGRALIAVLQIAVLLAALSGLVV